MRRNKTRVRNENKSLIKIIMIMNIILIIPASWIIGNYIVNKEFGETNKAAKSTLAQIESIESVSQKKQVVKDYDFVHQMSNNLIIAEDNKIRGYQSITLENIDLAIEMLENDSFIVEELNKWKKGEFENAVEVHNYCWRILGGNEGKAKGVSEKGIKNAKKNMLNE